MKRNLQVERMEQRRDAEAQEAQKNRFVIMTIALLFVGAMALIVAMAL